MSRRQKLDVIIDTDKKKYTDRMTLVIYPNFARIHPFISVFGGECEDCEAWLGKNRRDMVNFGNACYSWDDAEREEQVDDGKSDKTNAADKENRNTGKLDNE